MEQVMPLAEAEEIILQAGDRVLSYYQQREQLAVEYKGLQDLVSEADREVEKMLRRELSAAYPHVGFMGEELGFQDAEVVWVIDPIDGTTNFLRGIPEFAITLCQLYQGVPVMGLIYQPLRQVLLSAAKDRGAWLNGAPFRAAASLSDPSQAVIGFGYSMHGSSPDQAIAMLERWKKYGCVTRQTGSAATGLSMAILGQTDALYEPFVNSWDALAGQFIAEEAGLQSSPFLCGERLHTGGSVWIAQPGLVELMQE